MSLNDYMEKGGFIMYILLTFSILGFTIVIWKFIILQISKRKVKIISSDLLKNINEKTKDNQNPLYIELINEETEFKLLQLEKGLNTVKMIATLSPLLGLLGTVIGIFDSFEQISKHNMDFSFFANGISLALITTIAGLIVAIPHLIAYNYLIKSVDVLEKIIKKDILTLVLGEK